MRISQHFCKDTGFFRHGFTLSEVLLVLSVIGVVAALTIPTLVQKVNADQYKTAWKKNFSVLSQATQMILLNSGGNLKGFCTNHNCIKDAYANYLTVIKNCNSGTLLGNCWHGSVGGLKQLNGNVMSSWDGGAGLILSDGALLRIAFAASNCDSATAGTMFRCGSATVDVNGFKPPNTVGVDVFAIQILEDSTRPYGTDTDGETPNTTCLEGSTAGTNTGTGCSAKYLYQ